MCGQDFARGDLDMHRLDSQYAHQKDQDFGYFADNILLLCRSCHQKQR